MRAYLNTNFGDPIGRDLLALMRELRFDGPRQDIKDCADGGLEAEIAEAGMASILMLRTETWTAQLADLPKLIDTIYGAAAGMPVALEPGNELDGKMPALTYAKLFAEVERIVRKRQPDATIITAGIRDCGHGPLRWLRTVLSTGLVSEQSCVGFHTYRETPPGVPRSGFARREDELDLLRQVAGGRRLWHTEMGWSTAPRDAKGCAGWFGRKWSYTDEQVAEFLDYEYQIIRDFGSESFVLFQANDGERNDNEGRFGIRDYAGNLKPSAHVVARYA